MKKLLTLFILISVCTPVVFTVEVHNDALGFGKYISYFSDGGVAQSGMQRVAVKYFVDRDSDIYKKAAALDYRQNVIDSALEFIIFSYYSPAVKNIKPTEAEIELPSDNRTSELRLATAVYAKLQTIKFLDPQNRDRIGRYELMLHTIKQKNNIAQTEINTLFASHIAEIVSEEFTKISFLLKNTSTSHGAVLTRNPQNGHYKLSYEGFYTNNEIKEINMPTLNAVLVEMGNRKADFDQTGIDQVREQAKLIPAVVYADWKPNGVDAMALIVETLTNFYLSPDQTTYNNLLGLFARYSHLVIRERDVFAQRAQKSLEKSVTALNPDLMSKITKEISTGNIVALMRIPDDPRFNVFAARYTGR